MADRRLGVLLAALLLGGCAADAGSVRLLDRLCATRVETSGSTEPVWGCALSGDARATTGLPGDSTGVELGPGYGMLKIRLAALDRLALWPGALHRAEWSLDALVASARDGRTVLLRAMTWGACRDCPDDPPDVAFSLPEDYDWAGLAQALPGVGEPDSYEDATVIPADAWFVLSGADVQIADVRLPGIDPTAEGLGAE
jgi:hypothetical protein